MIRFTGRTKLEPFPAPRFQPKRAASWLHNIIMLCVPNTGYIDIQYTVQYIYIYIQYIMWKGWVSGLCDG